MRIIITNIELGKDKIIVDCKTDIGEFKGIWVNNDNPIIGKPYHAELTLVELSSIPKKCAIHEYQVLLSERDVVFKGICEGADEEDAFSYSVGDRVDLDNDGEKELIINGPYGGMYLDAREGQIYVLNEGWGTAGTLSYTEFDGQTWIVHSDVTHGGRKIHDFTLYDGIDNVTDEFRLSKEYWETPKEPDGPDTVYTYRDKEITREAYEQLVEKMLWQSKR